VRIEYQIINRAEFDNPVRATFAELLRKQAKV